MTQLPTVDQRPKFQSPAQAVLWSWIQLESTIIPLTAVRAAPGVTAQTGQVGNKLLLPFYTYESDSTKTTLKFRLPLTARSAVQSLLESNLLKGVQSLTTVVLTSFISWTIPNATTYALDADPAWVTSLEHFIAWAAKKHPGTVIEYNAGGLAPYLDFTVTINNTDLEGVNLLP